MPNVKIYTTILCPYCFLAKELLRCKGVGFEEIDLTGRAKERAELRDRAGGRITVPQIWVGEVHIGGYEELSTLNRAGKLDTLLAA